jgi:hypothetical protein
MLAEQGETTFNRDVRHFNRDVRQLNRDVRQ